MRKRPWLIGTLLLVLLVVTYRVQSARQAANGGGADARADAVPVEIADVKVGDLDEVARLTGNIEPIQSVQVIAKVGGRVARIHKHIGDPVQAGETLLVIDPVNYALDVKRLEGVLAQARANFGQAERDAGRSQRLFKDRVISTQALQAALSNQDISAGRVKEAEAALDLARQRLADTNVTSPIDGIVSRRSADVGTMVQTQIMGSREAVAVYEVKNLATVKLAVGISEKDLPRAEVGQTARISLRALPGEVFDGTLTHLSPSLARGTRRAEAEIQIANPEYRLKPGMFATAELILKRHTGVTLIPKHAVVERDGREVVFLVKEDRARMTPVELGGADDLSAIVASGVKPGDRLIVRGQTIVQDATPIRAEPASPAPVRASASASEGS
ncbi:MAG: efflux RND transporter periplasmic adaptor subunit [Myxococcota bacterium]